MSPERRSELALELAQTTTTMSHQGARNAVDACADEFPSDDARAERLARMCARFDSGMVLLALSTVRERLPTQDEYSVLTPLALASRLQLIDIATSEALGVTRVSDPEHAPARPTRDEMFMEFARAASRRSKCGRLVRVGAVVATWDGTSVVSMGYNGAAKGLQEDCRVDLPGGCGCVHAEANALLKAPYGPGLRMYVTLSPCASCARLIINSSVREVVYAEQYRDPAGLELLSRAGVDHRRLP